MDLADILQPEAVLPILSVASKKHAIQEIAERAARLTGLPEREIFDTLLQRERLGSTGIGHGIAVPHGKVVGLGRLTGIFARLDKPIPFEAIDDEPVDLVFVLLAPDQAGADHLRALALVTRILRQPDVAARLRAATFALEMHQILTTARADVA